nr:acetyltransferase [uncultured Treponema sp.]
MKGDYMEHLVLIGAGGYAKSVLDSIDYYNYKLEGFLDEFTSEKEHLGVPVIAHSLEEIPNKEKLFYFIAIGNNINRKRWYDKLKENRLRLINIVDRSAIISPRANIGTGCFVGKMAVINSMSTVGDNCIINTKALVEHGCTVGSHVNLSTNSVINGDVMVGEGSFIGSGSVTLGQKTIGSWSTVGAGAVVTKNVGDNVTVAGVPARILKQGAMLG